MNSSPNPRLAEVFARAVEAPPHERKAVLDRECVGDPSLRREVESLLAHDETLAMFREQVHPIDGPPIVPAMAIEAALAASSPSESMAGYAPGTVIDQYTVVREIGRGGFGVVYLAAQALADRPNVAVKVLESFALSSRTARRFQEEQRALANLNHPGIASIYTAGVTQAGHPYFAMEFVAAADGTTSAPHITDHADQHQLTVRQRVELFIPVCHAVQHAHQQRIIHRDLKPSNVLVEERDGRVQPKVIDFGIARNLEDDRTEDRQDPKALLTLSGEVIGTPAYMSPEQAAGEHVDTRSDVYSLGVVLYELLCGALPLPSHQRLAPVGEQRRAIQTEEPVRPSKAVLGAAAHTSTARGTDSRRLAKHLRGDLDTILRRLLEKDPALRFPSASAIAEDLRRYLSNQPIESRPHTLRYTLGKLAQRHRTFIAAAAIVFVSLVVAIAVSVSALNDARSSRQQSRLAAVTGNLTAAQYESLSEDGAALGRRLDAVPEELRDWEWRHLQLLADRSLRSTPRLDGMASALAISGDGKRLLVGDRAGNTSTWEAASMLRLVPTVTNPIPAKGGRDVWSVAWSPRNHLFATGSFDNAARIYNADGSLRQTIGQQGDVHYETVYAVAFSIDGRWLAVGGGLPDSPTSFVALHDVATGAGGGVNTTAHTAPVTDLAFSPNGLWLASSADDKRVCLWRLDGSKLEPAEPIVTGDKVNAVAFSPESSLIAAGTLTGEVELYRVPSREHADTLKGHRKALASVAFSPDGQILASASWDSTVRLWSVPEGKQLDVLRGHRGRVNRVAFAPNGRLFSASDDKTVREWDPTRRSEMRPLKVGDRKILALGVLANSDLALLFAGNSLHIVSAADGSTKFQRDKIQDELLAISPDGMTIAWRAADRVHTWRADRGPTPHPHPTMTLMPNKGVCAPDNRHLLLACDAGLLRLDHAANRWELLQPLPAGCQGGAPIHEWVSADGRVLSTLWGNDARHFFVNRDGRTEQLSPPWAVRWLTSGRYAVLADEEGRTLAVYDNHSGKLVATLEGHREKVQNVAFSPNGQRLASVDTDKTLRIWDWQRSLQVLSITYPPADGPDPSVSFFSLAWSPDGNTLVTGSTNGVVHFWPSQKP